MGEWLDKTYVALDGGQTFCITRYPEIARRTAEEHKEAAIYVFDDSPSSDDLMVAMESYRERVH